MPRNHVRWVPDDPRSAAGQDPRVLEEARAPPPVAARDMADPMDHPRDVEPDPPRSAGRRSSDRARSVVASPPGRARNLARGGVPRAAGVLRPGLAAASPTETPTAAETAVEQTLILGRTRSSGSA